MRNALFLVVLNVLFLTGCATNYYVDEDRYAEPRNYEKITVYVTNPEHEAYEILKRSDIYDLTTNQSAPDKLTFLNLSKDYHCGMGALTTVYTAGLVPSGLPTNQDLIYSLESEGNTKVYAHKLLYRDRFSVWETALKPFAYSLKGAQAKALSLSTRDICDDFRKCEFDRSVQM